MKDVTENKVRSRTIRVSDLVHHRARIAAAQSARTIGDLTEVALIREIARLERRAKPDPRP